jgi:hypothetical protein
VILTEGQGANDIFADQDLFVPPGESIRLAEVIEQAWNNLEFRERVAVSGHLFAESCGTKYDLRRRVLDVVPRLWRTEECQKYLAYC